MLKKIAFLLSSLGPVAASSDTIIPETVVSGNATVREDVTSDEFEESQEKWLECKIAFHKALWAFHSAWIDADLVPYGIYYNFLKDSEDLLKTSECMMNANEHTKDEHTANEKIEIERDETLYYKTCANHATALIEFCEKMKNDLCDDYIDREERVEKELEAQECLREWMVQFLKEIAHDTRRCDRIRRWLSHTEENIRVLNDILQRRYWVLSQSCIRERPVTAK
jgi:hypothetical protein